MKNIITIFALVAITFSASAQKNIDLETTLTSPLENASLVSNVPFDLNYTIKNIGDDTFEKGDSIVVLPVLNGKTQQSLLRLKVLHKDLKKGDTVNYIYPINVTVNTASKVTICMGLLYTKTGAIKYKDANSNNNSSCANISMWLTSSISSIDASSKLAVFPNPANKKLNIEYTLTKSAKTNIKLYDVTGKLVKTLYNQKQNIGKNLVTADVSNIPSGVYFYKITINNESVSKRLIINH